MLIFSVVRDSGAVNGVLGRVFIVVSDAQLEAHNCENKKGKKQPTHICWNDVERE